MSTTTRPRADGSSWVIVKRASITRSTYRETRPLLPHSRRPPPASGTLPRMTTRRVSLSRADPPLLCGRRADPWEKRESPTHGPPTPARVMCGTAEVDSHATLMSRGRAHRVGGRWRPMAGAVGEHCEWTGYHVNRVLDIIRMVQILQPEHSLFHHQQRSGHASTPPWQSRAYC